MRADDPLLGAVQRDAAERATSVRRDAGIGGIRTEGGAPKRRRVGQGLVLARKFNELARMFDAVTTVADLRMRRGEPPVAEMLDGVFKKVFKDKW